jgi:hypothetical protein
MIRSRHGGKGTPPVSSVQVYKVVCRRCDSSKRVPGWDATCEEAHKHAEHGGYIQIKREWLLAA